MKRSGVFTQEEINFKKPPDMSNHFQQKQNVQNFPHVNNTVANNFGQGPSGSFTNKSVSVNNQKRESNENYIQNRFNFFGKSVTEKTYFFTGTVERIIKWHRIFKQCCYFEVIASVVSVQEGSVKLQRIILLRDRKGPLLQVIHYLNHVVQVTDISTGQMLRCVGYMTGPNALTAVSIRLASPEEITTLKRHCYVGDFAITGLLNAYNNQ